MAFIPALARAIYRQGYLPLPGWNVTRDDAKAIAASALTLATPYALSKIANSLPIPSLAKTALYRGAQAILHSKTARAPLRRHKNHLLRPLRHHRRHRHKRFLRHRLLPRKYPQTRRRRYRSGSNGYRLASRLHDRKRSSKRFRRY